MLTIVCNDEAIFKYLVVVSHPNDEVHELLEVELGPGESISHKELPIVPIEVSLQPDQCHEDMEDQAFVKTYLSSPSGTVLVNTSFKAASRPAGSLV